MGIMGKLFYLAWERNIFHMERRRRQHAGKVSCRRRNWGVGGVFVFLPNIILLFFALAILEDSGYMARAAFLCDRIMKRFGLSGSSVIPDAHRIRMLGPCNNRNADSKIEG